MSVANLVVIAVMVVIFGAALLLPFPRGHPEEPTAVAGEATDGDLAAVAPGAPDDEDARIWTARLRRRALMALSPGKLLPYRQPAYVAF